MIHAATSIQMSGFFCYDTHKLRMSSWVIENTIQAPRASRGSLVKGRSQANAVAQKALIAHWQSIVKSLNNYLKMMKANYVSSKFILECQKFWVFRVGKFHLLIPLVLQVPAFLVRKVFTQIFSFINVQLFNRYIGSISRLRTFPTIFCRFKLL